MTTRSALCLLLPLLCLLSFGDLTSSAELPPSEISTLKVIAEKLKIGPNLWNFSLEPCFGWKKSVENNLNCTCDVTTNVCHVRSIILKSEDLQGEFPEEFSNLPQLRIIDLTRNYINGSIPPSLAKLPLTKISLVGNRISGEIPKEIGSITTLGILNCQSNQLRGRIPDSFGNLSGLWQLTLSGNDLVGELPPSLGKLTNLTDLRIDGTGLSGKLPSFIGNWTPLKILLTRGTSLEGPFPSTFSELTKMEELRVTDFKGDGGFPPIENMTSLVYLSLRNCSISGPIPEYLGKFINLMELDLSFNKFAGRIPPSLEALSDTITHMYLTDNSLNGTIPDWIFGEAHIDLSYNYFTGPDKGSCQIGEVNLVSSFQSSQSDNITYCLTKNLPCSTGATNYKLFINCGGPSLEVNGTKYESDNFPNGISTYHISTNKNWAYSSTGDFVGGNRKFLANNNSALKTTNSLYQSARAAASSLKYYGHCLRSGDYTVKLHFAEILYTDDETFFSLGRRFFDVSIQGKKVLEDFNIAAKANGTGRELVKSFKATVNNTFLELDFRWSGKGTNTVPAKGNYGPLISAISVTPNFKVDLDENKDDGLSTGAIVSIVVGCLAAISLVILIPCILLCKKNERHEELEPLKMKGAYFSLRQIKDATKDFDPESKIGQGSFGSVYKGVLPDGSIVAIKQLSSKSKQGNREFLNEIGMISALDHPNLVKLFGCCIEGKQLILVYEYMENNCLGRALFGPVETRFNLGWNQRCAISLGIARGLAYLHDGSSLKIVHRDIKATNILLDKDLNARISDFGLAKLDDEDKSHISTRIAGTMGYMAPEYAMRGYLTEKADVYSYGIVLLEIVSGKSNSKYKPKEDFFYLLDWVHVLKDKGELLELVDPNLGSNYSAVEAEKMLNLSLLCTNPSPSLRPTMTWVVSMMEGKTPVAAPPEVVDQTASIGRNFKPLEKIYHDSQSISYDGPFTDSSLPSIRN